MTADGPPNLTLPAVIDRRYSPKSTLALIPLHQLVTRILALVEPLQAKRLFAQDCCLETSPCLNFKVIERTTMRTQPMRDSRRKVNKRAGFDFLEFVVNFDKAAAFESH